MLTSIPKEKRSEGRNGTRRKPGLRQWVRKSTVTLGLPREEEKKIRRSRTKDILGGKKEKRKNRHGWGNNSTRGRGQKTCQGHMEGRKPWGTDRPRSIELFSWHEAGAAGLGQGRVKGPHRRQEKTKANYAQIGKKKPNQKREGKVSRTQKAGERKNSFRGSTFETRKPEKKETPPPEKENFWGESQDQPRTKKKIGRERPIR